MTYEVKLSDTARQDLDRAAPDQSARVTRLLHRIAKAESAASDHVLSAGSGFELRYQTEGPSYIFFRRDAGQVSVVYFTDLDAPRAGGMLAPREQGPPRLLGWQIRDIPGGVEMESTAEFTAADGSSRLRYNYARRVDLGASYMMFVHMNSPDGAPFTAITTALKGPVQGDWRREDLETVILRPDGGVERSSQKNVPVWIKFSLEGLTAAEIEARLRERQAALQASIADTDAPAGS